VQGRWQQLWLAEAVDNPSSLIVAYAGLGSLYLCKGDLHQAISALEHGLRICQDTMLDNPNLAKISVTLVGN
jgi:hypothetical protein